VWQATGSGWVQWWSLEERPGLPGAGHSHFHPVPASSNRHTARAQLSPSASSEALSCFLMENAFSVHISDFKKDLTVCTSSCRCRC